MSREKYFCYMPWVYTQITPAGGASFCCLASDNVLTDAQGKPIHISSNPDADDILNSAKNKFIRKELLSIKKPVACMSCWDIENTGGCSPRLAINEGLTKYIDKKKLIAATDETGHLADPQFRYLELRLGNVCNMKCRFCGPQNSSSWYGDYEKLFGTSTYEDGKIEITTNSKENYNWPSSDEFMVWFDKHSEGLLNLQFVGGEPLLSPTHHRILKFLIDSGKSKKLNLIYTTNGTIVDDWLFDSWKKFKSVMVYVSIEGTGKIYDYQRWPASWAEIEKNIIKFKSFVGKSISQLVIQPNVNIYNVASIGELGKWAMQQGKELEWNKHLNFITNPAWQSAYIFTKEEKDLIILEIGKSIKSINESFPNSKKRQNIVSWLISVQEILHKHDWTHLRKESLAYNIKLDEIRNGHAADYLDALTVSFFKRF